MHDSATELHQSEIPALNARRTMQTHSAPDTLQKNCIKPKRCQLSKKRLMQTPNNLSYPKIRSPFAVNRARFSSGDSLAGGSALLRVRIFEYLRCTFFEPAHHADLPASSYIPTHSSLVEGRGLGLKLGSDTSPPLSNSHRYERLGVKSSSCLGPCKQECHCARCNRRVSDAALSGC